MSRENDTDFEQVKYEIMKALREIEPLKGWKMITKVNQFGGPDIIQIGNDDQELVDIGRGWGKNNKINIGVDWPKSRDGKVSYEPHKPYDHNKPWFTIKVSPDRTADAIAADIIRRLLPEYRAELIKIRERIAIHQEAYDRRDNLANRLHCVLNTAARKEQKDMTCNQKFEAGSYSQEWLGIPKCDIEISSGAYHHGNRNEVIWELRIEDEHLNLEIARVIQRHIADKTLEHKQTISSDERLQNIYDYVIREWDEEHMGPLPSNNTEACRIFSQYFKEHDVAVPWKEIADNAK